MSTPNPVPATDWVSAADILPAPGTPAALGFNPAKFPGYRAVQTANVENIVNSPCRITAHNMPVGTGKSLAAMSIAKILDTRTLYLTATNQLLTQLSNDFPECALIKGRANYRCPEGFGSCEEGAAGGCMLRTSRECTYQHALDNAKESKIVISNYHYALAMAKGEGLGPRNLLIMDEGHDAPDIICSSVAVTITAKEIRLTDAAMPPTATKTLAAWSKWAAAQLPAVKSATADLERQATLDKSLAKDVITARRFLSGLTAILEADALGEPWAVDGWTGTGGGDRKTFTYTLTPVHPGRYTEQRLFRGVPQVAIYSATIAEHSLSLMGLSDYDFCEYDSPFPLDRMPFYFWPVAQLSAKAPADNLRKIVAAIDQIIEHRLDRRGIIHTGSYARSQEIYALSRYADLMVTHDAKDTARMLEYFKSSPAPTVFLSPSMTTGYDFAGDIAEYQIIPKLPFPDCRGNLMQARTAADSPKGSRERILGYAYLNYSIASTLAQIAGRTMRSAVDRSETFILDMNMSWFYAANQRHFPMTFRRAFKRVSAMPAPYKPSLYVATGKTPQPI